MHNNIALEELFFKCFTKSGQNKIYRCLRQSLPENLQSHPPHPAHPPCFLCRTIATTAPASISATTVPAIVLLVFVLYLLFRKNKFARKKDRNAVELHGENLK